MPTPTRYKCLKCTSDFELMIWSPEEQAIEEKRRPVTFNRPKCEHCGSPEVVLASAVGGARSL